MMRWGNNANKGFTIVELLIVVVVIAILAAITIVAFNGIQQQARNSAVQSAVSQVAKKIQLHAVQNNNSYPLNFSDLAINQEPDTEYVYTSDTSSAPGAYCISVTKNTTSFYIESSQQKPLSGKCPITNLLTNPSLETNTTGWANHSSSMNANRVQQGGKWLLTGTRTDTAAMAMHVNFGAPTPVTVGKVYTASALVSSSAARSLNLQIRQGGTGSILLSETHNFSAGEEKRISVSGIATTPLIHISLRGDVGVVGETYTIDEAMLTEGTVVHPYADGATTNWNWSGTQHGSTSSGPAL